ncbi:FadR/GntR family transcriptional regulator [Devosia sp. A369]
MALDIPTPGDTAETSDAILVRLEELLAADSRRPSERKLAELLGVNRYVLRRALARLSEEGRISPLARRRRKSSVLGWVELSNQTNPVEIGEIRIALEPGLARLAAMRATPNDIAQLTALHEEALSRPYDVDLDLAFHQAVAKASGNQAAFLLISTLNEITRDPDFIMKMPAFTEETGFRHHATVLAAIRGRDGNSAQEAMLTHYRAIQRWLLGEQPEAAAP